MVKSLVFNQENFTVRLILFAFYQAIYENYPNYRIYINLLSVELQVFTTLNMFNCLLINESSEMILKIRIVT